MHHCSGDCAKELLVLFRDVSSNVHPWPHLAKPSHPFVEELSQALKKLKLKMLFSSHHPLLADHPVVTPVCLTMLQLLVRPSQNRTVQQCRALDETIAFSSRTGTEPTHSAAFLSSTTPRGLSDIQSVCFKRLEPVPQTSHPATTSQHRVDAMSYTHRCHHTGFQQ